MTLCMNILKSVATLSILLLSLMAFAKNGIDRGGGGDHIEPEIRAIAKSIHESIKDIPLYRDFYKIPMSKFEKLIKNAEIDTTYDEISVLNQETGEYEIKTAWNNYKDFIRINIPRWDAISSPVLKRRLVFHEFLSLMGLEWNNYYVISDTLYADSNLVPQKVELGIMEELDEHQRYFAMNSVPKGSNRDIDTTLVVLNSVYTYSIERLLEIYTTLSERPELLSNERQIAKIQYLVLDIINRANMFMQDYNYVQAQAPADAIYDIQLSDVMLKNIQVSALSLKISDLIDNSGAYQNYLRKGFNSNAREDLLRMTRQYREETKTARAALNTTIETQLLIFQDLKSDRSLNRGLKTRARFLEQRFVITQELLVLTPQ